MSTQEKTSKKDQYTLWQILGIWLAGRADVDSRLAGPSGLEVPAMDAGRLGMKLDIVALVWRFVLSMLIL